MTSSFYTCQPLNHSAVDSFCRDLLPSLPTATCLDAAGYRKRSEHDYKKQRDECSSEHKRKKTCPNEPSECSSQVFSREEYCGVHDQRCTNDDDCIAYCFSDCYPCNDRSDCEILESFGVIAPEGAPCFSPHNHSVHDRLREVLAELRGASSPPALSATPASVTPASDAPHPPPSCTCAHASCLVSFTPPTGMDLHYVQLAATAKSVTATQVHLPPSPAISRHLPPSPSISRPLPPSPALSHLRSPSHFRNALPPQVRTAVCTDDHINFPAQRVRPRARHHVRHLHPVAPGLRSIGHLLTLLPLVPRGRYAISIRSHPKSAPSIAWGASWEGASPSVHCTTSGAPTYMLHPARLSPPPPPSSETSRFLRAYRVSECMPLRVACRSTWPPPPPLPPRLSERDQ